MVRRHLFYDLLGSNVLFFAVAIGGALTAVRDPRRIVEYGLAIIIGTALGGLSAWGTQIVARNVASRAVTTSEFYLWVVDVAVVAWLLVTLIIGISATALVIDHI